MIRYHDEEWGVPVHDDRLLFEFLILEGAQAGLSWETVLRKRERYREVFDGFDAAKNRAIRRAGKCAPARRSGDHSKPVEDFRGHFERAARFSPCNASSAASMLTSGGSREESRSSERRADRKMFRRERPNPTP